ncbi:MAG: YoaK family protein [Rhodoferax sp.]
MFPLIRGWTDVDRSTRTNVRLGAVLALVAGAANAGGFLAVGQYTSHMTGVVSSVADHLILGDARLIITGIGSYLAFVLGAMTTAILVNWGLRRHLRSAYGLPLLLEALLLLVFGLFGAVMNAMTAVLVPLTIVLLCFMMGLQNAVISKISKSEIRTTHVTGLTTDLGVELGKLLYVNRNGMHAPVLANRRRLRLHGLLIACFFTGGVLGALGFRSFGYVTTVPLALMLLLLVARPVLDDLHRGR